MNSEIIKGSIGAGQLSFSQDKTILKSGNETNAIEVKKTETEKTLRVEANEPTDTVEKLKDSVVRLNDFVTSVQRDLRFSVDELSGRTVITVSDTKTNEIIRQIPSKEVLALAQNIDSAKGILFSAEV